MVVFAIHQHESATVHMCLSILTTPHLPPHPNPLGCPRAPALSTLLHALTLHQSSTLHQVIYMFQCYQVTSSHPCLLPRSPKVCSLHLCLFCCLTYRVIVTVFLNFIYTRVILYCIGVFFLAYFTLYNRFQFHPPH